MSIQNTAGLRGEVTIPGDKSISHRAVMFGSIADGLTEVTNFLQGADCLSTISCFRKLGIEIENTSDKISVHGKGLHGLSAPSSILDVGNSGTTMRLISGILAAQPFETELTGDASIQKRPMRRIMEPLSMMGADIVSINNNDCAPLRIIGNKVHGIDYHSKVASAQVNLPFFLPDYMQRRKQGFQNLLSAETIQKSCCAISVPMCAPRAIRQYLCLTHI